MQITKKFLESKNACESGLEWVTEHNLLGLNSIDFLNKLIELDKLDWANWLIVRVMERKQYIAYAIFAAEQVIDIYEKKCPDDKKTKKSNRSC